MYRIRLASGEEAVYRTVQELAAAVASGMVSPDAEVYHKAANRWLPINTHPDYRAAMVTGQQTAINPAISIPGPPAEGTPPGSPSGKQGSLKVGPPSGQQPAIKLTPAAPTAKGPAVPPLGRQRTSKTTALPEDVDKFELLDPIPLEEPSKTSTRQSAAIPLMPPTPASTIKTAAIDPTVGPPGPVPPLPPEAEMIDLTAPEPPIITAPIETLVQAPPPPKKPLLDRNKLVLIASIAALICAIGFTALIITRTGSGRSQGIDTLPSLPSEALRDTTFKDTFTVVNKPVTPAPAKPIRGAKPVPAETFPAPSRPVTPPPVKRETPKPAPVPVAEPPKPRPAGSKAPSYFQAYADARAEMDQSLSYVAFRRVFAPGRFVSMDSLRATKRMVVAAGNILRVYRGREVQLEQTFRPDDPGGRNSLREPFETSEASRALLSDVDSLFGLLVNQEGEITVSEREIRFRSSRAAAAYNAVRREILTAIATWRDSAEASNRVTMPRLVQALGAFQPPVAR